jgi:hypothetical protein
VAPHEPRLDHGELWPQGDLRATPEWIASNVDGILATVERLYAVAIRDFPGSDDFFDRLVWLPPLLAEFDGRHAPTLDGSRAARAVVRDQYFVAADQGP